ncbi:TetR/AcrR family transcriptional regulator [Nocardia nepalensis]|uniref:TetR/AcrR family transcriptional regulator n=1 Tax=Nocardia nepalensis TaxID=3375448 RepID=UPI003B67DB2E
MPRLWNTTIETHRREVREAILATTSQLVLDRGLRSVTMSQIADATGISRATLYKYFPDVESILIAWHEREVAAHLDELTDIMAGIDGAPERLAAGLLACAMHNFQARKRHEAELAHIVHHDDHVAHADAHLRTLLADLITAARAEGAVRGDVDPGELADYCRHALGAATAMTEPEAVQRLVSLTLAGLRPAR